MGFEKRIRNLIWIARISRINSKLKESFTRDINPHILGHKPILGFSRKILLVGSFFLCCLLMAVFPYNLLHVACATSSARASPLLEEVQAPEPQGVPQRGAVATRSEPRGFV